MQSAYATALLTQYLEKNAYIQTLEALKKSQLDVREKVGLINSKTRKIAKKNKEKENPCKSLLEAIVEHVSDGGRLLSKKTTAATFDKGYMRTGIYPACFKCTM